MLYVPLLYKKKIWRLKSLFAVESSISLCILRICLLEKWNRFTKLVYVCMKFICIFPLFWFALQTCAPATNFKNRFYLNCKKWNNLFAFVSPSFSLLFHATGCPGNILKLHWHANNFNRLLFVFSFCVWY